MAIIVSNTIEISLPINSLHYISKGYLSNNSTNNILTLSSNIISHSNGIYNTAIISFDGTSNTVQYLNISSL